MLMRSISYGHATAENRDLKAFVQAFPKRLSDVPWVVNVLEHFR